MNWPYLRTVLSHFTNYLVDIKSYWIIKLTLSIIAWLVGFKFWIFSAFMFLFLDMITGIWAAKKTGVPITSKRLKDSLIKAGLYMILYIVAFMFNEVLASMLHFENHIIVWALTILIDTYEAVSIIENVIKISPELAFLSKLSNLLNHAADDQLKNVADKLGETQEEQPKSEK